MIIYLFVALVAYLLGSIPSGYLVGKYCGVDLRKEGSGNIGATNTVRVIGKKWGAVVLAADFLKGVLAVAGGFRIATAFGLQGQLVINAGVVAGICAVLGHNYPVWLKFQGGKGIAVSAGVVLTLFPLWLFLSGLIAWLALFFGTRYVSVASIGTAVVMPLVACALVVFGLCDPVRMVIVWIMGALAIWRHKSNIKRLLAGTEKRFDRKS